MNLKNKHAVIIQNIYALWCGFSIAAFIAFLIIGQYWTAALWTLSVFAAGYLAFDMQKNLLVSAFIGGLEVGKSGKTGIKEL